MKKFAARFREARRALRDAYSLRKEVLLGGEKCSLRRGSIRFGMTDVVLKLFNQPSNGTSLT